jgi:fructosamine-3-kinase
MTLPEALRRVLESSLGASVSHSVPVGGGSICHAAKIALTDGRTVLVKWRDGLPGMFTAERRGLELLRAADALRTPAVLAQQEASAEGPAFIAMEWLGRGATTEAVAEALGQGLARLHRTIGPAFGLDHPNFIGANPQRNTPADNWVEFFGGQRLGFQLELLGKNGHLTAGRRRGLERLINRLGDWLPAQPEASLLHGDLWGGNWLVTADGVPALIDPAVYYGHREAELAFTELFGGFSATFYAAYAQTWPLDGDYRERKDLYNLYHLLNHLNLFGEGYGSGVDAILHQYAGR